MTGQGLKVITESGQTLGWVKEVVFSTNSQPFVLRLIASPLLWLPESITGLYELAAHEIATPCSDRLIAFSQLERTITCQKVGLLMRFGLSEAFQKVSSDGYILPCPPGPFDDEGPASSPIPVGSGPNPSDSDAAMWIDE